MIKNEEEYLRMSEVETTHWWYRILHQKVEKAISTHLPEKDVSIVAVGCGTGGNIEYLISKGYPNIKGFDISEIAIRFCKGKKLDVFQSCLTNITDHFSSSSIDVLIVTDVLYFFPESDWRKITNDFFHLLKKDGIVVMNLPALSAFSGMHDLCVGILHRFSKSDLNYIFDPDQFICEETLYWPFFLSPVIYLTRLKQRLALKFFKQSKHQSDLNQPGKWINSLLYSLTQFETILKNIPWGSSLFVVVKKRIR